MDQLSVGSVISLRSVSEGTGLEGERKHARRNSTGSKKIKKPASPYGTTKSLPKKQTKRTGREIWVESVQRGGGLSSEGKVTNTWRHGKPPYLANATSATPFLRDQLLAVSGSPLPNRVSRPSSASSARVGGTGPVYKDAESYYDEIQILKRQLKQLKNENDEAKAKNVRMEDEIIAKSRKIEELLNPELQSNDLRRTLTSKKPSTSEVVMSLRRKIYKLEENLRDKEASVKEMKRDIKMSDMEEINLENQVYLYEIGRLTQIIKEVQLKNTQNTVSEDAINEAMKETEGNKTQILLKRLTEDNQGLVLENKSLKNDLMKLTKGNQTDVNLHKDYEDMNRNELLQKISSLEQRLKVEEKKISVGDLADSPVDSENIDDRCINLQGPLPQQIKQLRARERELLSEVESLENTVKKLKEDRTHYRKKNDEYRLQMDNMKKKVDEVGSDTASVKSEKSPKHRKSPVNARKNSDKVSKIKEDKVTEARIEELQQTNAARKIQRGWRKRQNVVLENELKEKGEEEELENAIISIQSSWRGHKAREAYINSLRNEYHSELSNQDNDDLDDEDVRLIQSALRGHSSRKQLLLKSKKRTSLSDKSVVSSAEDEARYFNSEVDVAEETDDDDDVVIGSSASLLNYRPPDIRSLRNSRSPTNNSISQLSHSSRMNHLSGSQYSDTIEKSESKFAQKLRIEEEGRQNSLKSLKSSSSPWPESIHDDIESEGSEQLESSSKNKKKSKKSTTKEGKRQKSDIKDEKDIANKWASSGNKDSAEEGSFQKRLSMRRSQQLLKDFEDDDEDDLVVGAAFQKKLGSLGNRKELLDDELF